MISCGEGKNTPRNWQLNTCSLHFYISLQLWRMHLCVPVIVLQHGGEDGTLAFTPFFHFYFFIFYNHLAILDYEAHPISSCIPLFICIHNQALAFGELAERQSVQQKKKIFQKEILFTPRVWRIMCCWFGPRVKQWANGKRPPDPPFSYILSGARGL